MCETDGGRRRKRRKVHSRQMQELGGGEGWERKDERGQEGGERERERERRRRKDGREREREAQTESKRERHTEKERDREAGGGELEG